MSMLGSLLSRSISLSEIVHWLVAIVLVVTVVHVATGGHYKLAVVLAVFAVVASLLGARAARARMDAERLISPHSRS